MEIILGIDPGTRFTGFAVLRSEDKKTYLEEYGLIDNSKEKDFHKRLVYIHKEMKEIVSRIKPTKMIIENVPYARNFKSTSKMLQVFGVIILPALQSEIEVIGYFPKTVKMVVTGTGNAGKNDVRVAVSRIFNLKLQHEKDDISDAIAIGLCYFRKDEYDESKRKKRKKKRKKTMFDD